MIKTNALSLRTRICIVLCKMFSCIRTVTLLNTWSNDITEDLCTIREVFNWYGIQDKAKIFILVIFYKYNSFHKYLWVLLRDFPIILGVRDCFSLQNSICETIDLNSSNIYQSYSRSVGWYIFLWQNWSCPLIYHIKSDRSKVHQVTLLFWWVISQ